MPHDLPPWEAVYQQAQRWLAAGCFEQLADDLRALLRLASGRSPEPSAAILDSRTLRSTPESGERAGYDGAKRKKGSKVHLAVDTLGHLLALHVTPADVDDRAQVGHLAEAVQAVTGDSVDLAYVDQGYTGEKPAKAAREQGIELEVVKLPEAKRGFILLPRRWVVVRRTILLIRRSSGPLAFHASGWLTALEPIAPRFGRSLLLDAPHSAPMEVHMGRSTPQAVVVARISFETTRLSPQCLVEAYARILPVTRKPLVTAGPVPAQTRRTEHG